MKKYFFKSLMFLMATYGINAHDNIEAPNKIETPKDIYADIKNVDFDVSLGKNEELVVDGTSYNLLDCLLSPTTKFSGGWDAASRPLPVSDLYNFLKKLYEKNAPQNVKLNEFYKIPPRIHQIWIQGELPEKFKAWQKTWQELLPGWEYTIWTDKEISQLNLKNRARYDAATNYGEKSDIARYEIIYQFGGIYVDIDFECLKPEMFELLNKSYDFYSCLAPLDCAHLCVASGIFGAKPGHPIMKKIIDNISDNYDDSVEVHFRAGPIPFTKAFWSACDKPECIDIILPPSFCYPVGTYNVVGGSYNNVSYYKSLIKPESIAIHYWGRSWSCAPRY